MDEAEFRRRVGTPPVQDDLDRVNCPKAGEMGHWQCGWCEEHDRPRFMCGCVLMDKTKGEADQSHLMVANIRWVRDHRTMRYLDNISGEVVPYEEVQKWEGDPRIVERGGRLLNPVAVDMQSANVFMLIYDNLSPANKANITSVTVAWACKKAWQVYGKTKTA